MTRCIKKGGIELILTVTLNPSIDRRYDVIGFEKGKIFRTKDYQYTPGGKGLNVTRVIKAFNEPVIATGFLGGRSGGFIEEKLDIMGIKHRFVPINGETRSCLAIISDDGSQTEILEGGPSISGEETVKFYELYRELIKDVCIVCGSGSLPHGIPSETYRNLIVMAKEEGKKFILDTSGEALKEGIKASPFLIKPNKEELENLMGYKIESSSDIIQSGKYLLENDIEIVIISLGKEGAMVFNDGYLYKIKVPEVKVINPVGSGDSMIGGFAASLLRDYDFEFILKVAAACGTANAMESETGKVDMNNMKKVLNEITIEKIRL